MIRTLTYHCCPLVDNDLWLRNMEQLLARWHVFDGKRIIAVSRGDGIRPLDDVRRVVDAAMGDQWVPVEYVVVNNDRRLREVASFRRILDRVLDQPGRDSAVFYAHTKGNSTYDDVQGAIYWRNTMYHRLLDHADHCVGLIERGVPAVGCNKLVWRVGQRSPYPSGLMHGRWMFAGTFFWYSSARARERDWRNVPNDRYGAEAWLAGMYEPDECVSVFQPWPESKYPGVNPYDPELYVRAGSAIEDIELRHPMYFI